MSFIDCCRLCLVDLTDVTLDADGHFVINESTMENRPLQNVIQECFQITLTNDETMNKICDSCYSNVQFVEKIRRKVHETDVAIKNYYSQLNFKYDVEYLVEDQDTPLVDINEASDEILPFELDSNHKNGDDYDNKGDSQRISLVEHDEHLKKDESFFVEVEKHKTQNDKCNQKSGSKTSKLRKTNKSNAENRKRDKFTCFICSTDFDNFEELDDHLPTHVGSVTSICHLCGLEVTTVRHLNMHLQRIHYRKGKRIPCLECQNDNITREFSSNYLLQAHIKKVHQGIVEIVERKYVCTYCGKSFSRATYLRIHENIHTKSVIFKCKHCTNFTTTARSALLRHQRIHTSEKPYKCDMCEASFSQTNGLQAHKISRHNDERPFVCNLCGDNVRFKSKYTLRSHMRIHENNNSGNMYRPRNNDVEKPLTERELKCNFCPAVYYKERFLCRHIIDKHPSENISMIPCEICNEMDKRVFFLTQKEKDLHTNNHTKTKTVIPQQTRVCKDCGETFQNSDSLARHRQRQHFIIKCNECGKVYKKRTSLRLHYLTVHYESRPFKCDKCNASYGQLTQLTAHMKNHS